MLSVTCLLIITLSVGDWSFVQVLQFIERNGRLKQPQLCPTDMYALMHRCWSYTAVDRPTFKDIHNELQISSNYENVQLKKA